MAKSTVVPFELPSEFSPDPLNEQPPGKYVCRVFKTPLWRNALQLDTDNMLRPIAV